MKKIQAVSKIAFNFKMAKQLNNLTPTGRSKFLTGLEWFVVTGIVLVAAAAVYTTFFSDTNGQGTVVSQFTSRTDALDRESDPIRRDALCVPLSAFCRSIDAQLPTNSKVFLLDMLGPTNQGNLGYYYFLNNYLYPREVAISIGKPAKFVNQGVEGRDPASIEELAQAGYDLVLKRAPDGGWQSQALKPLPPSTSQKVPVPISKTDTYISFLLPLALALAGTRLVRWLFADLIPVLTMGELLACGLAVGMFVLTQLILLLRMMGARLEWFIGIAIIIWALLEIVLLLRDLKPSRFEFNIRHLWWLLLIPAGLVFWWLFRLAGLEGMLEFDAIAHWEFKSKLLYYTSGNEIWAWSANPAYGYAILNNPLMVSLLYTFQWGVLGHINEFVIKFWNQWMLLLIVFALLGAGKFGGKRSWLTAATSITIILLPITLLFARWEGSTIPFFFYVVLASIQLALGLAENEPRRLRLGLFILMGSAMVKIDGGILFGVWGLLLLLDKGGRTALWPLKRIGMAGLVGFMMWAPFFYFRAHAIGHFNDLAPRLVIQNWPAAANAAPMVWLALISRRLFNNDFAAWTAPDNEHAIWAGKWMGLQSFADSATLGLGWVGLLILFYFWMSGYRLRRISLFFGLVFSAYSIVVCITFLGWSLGLESQTHKFYTRALSNSETITGGRYLYPLLMSWFVAGSILLSRQERTRLLSRNKN